MNNVKPAQSGPVTDGLVLWYDPSDVNSYPESGTTVYDLSGNNQDGTMTNVSWTSPYFLFNFPTTNAYISVPDNALLEPGSGSYSIEIWFSPGLQDGNQYILSKGPFNNFSDLSYAVTRTFGTVNYPWWASGSTGVQNTQSAMLANEWYQRVYVLSRSPQELYTYDNGTKIRTNSHTLGSINNLAVPLYLGSLSGTSSFFAGRIGIVRLYNRALSTAEITTNFNNDRSLYSL
jgi:hypothetical protein